MNVDNKRQPTDCYTHYAFSATPTAFDHLKQKIIASGATCFKENSSPGESFYFLDPDGHKLELHTGDCKSRIASKKTEPGNWKDIEWFV